jgi:hypothetical protein
MERKRPQELLPPVPVSPQDDGRMEQVTGWLEPWARGKERTAARELGEQVDAATAAWLAVPTTVKHEFARMTFGPTEAHLRFFGKDRSVRGTMGSAKLSRLAWASEDMAQAAGWNQPAQATTYLLLGVAAPNPHMSIATMVYRFGPSHGQPESLRRREATLTIRESDFSYDELREIWRRLWRQGITEKKPLQQRHADVWKFVEKGRADGKTWQQVLDEWNADPSHHYYFWSASTVRSGGAATGRHLPQPGRGPPPGRRRARRTERRVGRRRPALLQPGGHRQDPGVGQPRAHPGGADDRSVERHATRMTLRSDSYTT